MQHPDHIRRKQPRLHVAAEQHRFTMQQIEAVKNEGSRNALMARYGIKSKALEKAIREVLEFQDEVFALHTLAQEAEADAKQDRAIAELLRA